MPNENTHLFFQVPTKSEEMAYNFLKKLLNDGKIAIICRGRGELMIVSATKTKTIRVVNFEIVVKGGQETAKEIAKDLLSKKVVPSGKEWIIMFDYNPSFLAKTPNS